ncbi:MAG: zinc ribbon domain-containing protein, partial [Acidimicrobiales bacterium]|nr:zinc ribbon domain-containing protein [Acidimicrobiales bacterium]
MAVTCPNGHPSESTDYCDTCGALIAVLPPLTAPPADPGVTASGTRVMTHTPVQPGATCPNCGGPRQPDEVFCEVCGLNFATGLLPSPGAELAAADPEAVTAEWVAVISSDHRYFESNQAESPDATVTFPTD